MMDFIDDFNLNRETKILQYVMIGDWRYKLDIILEVEEIDRSAIEAYKIDYNGATTHIYLRMR